jgi:hypothetical protein
MSRWLNMKAAPDLNARISALCQDWLVRHLC